mgnify:CR=1 FL=1
MMHLSFHSFIRLFLSAPFLVAGISVFAQVIPTTPVQREALIESVKPMLDEADQGAQPNFAQIPYPFTFEEPQAPVAIVENTKPEPEPEPEPEKEPEPPSDQEVLDEIAGKLDPRGSIELGGVNHLILSGNRRLKEGDVIVVRVIGGERRIVLSQVTSGFFILRLNDSEKKRDFSDARSGASIQQ